jgi:hypothetical protein
MSLAAAWTASLLTSAGSYPLASMTRDAASICAAACWIPSGLSASTGPSWFASFITASRMERARSDGPRSASPCISTASTASCSSSRASGPHSVVARGPKPNTTPSSSSRSSPSSRSLAIASARSGSPRSARRNALAWSPMSRSTTSRSFRFAPSARSSSSAAVSPYSAGREAHVAPRQGQKHPARRRLAQHPLGLPHLPAVGRAGGQGLGLLQVALHHVHHRPVRAPGHSEALRRHR